MDKDIKITDDRYERLLIFVIIAGTNCMHFYLQCVIYLCIKTEIYIQNIEYMINKNVRHNHSILRQKYK